MAWNDTDVPLAYLITFRAYGTWLHGDARGSTDRHNNTFGRPRYEQREHWESITRERLKWPPVKLNESMRASTEKAIKDTCRIRGWDLFALNVRTNHVHVVVAVGAKKASSALNAFKANATRAMREDRCWTAERSPWADKGSE